MSVLRAGLARLRSFLGRNPIRHLNEELELHAELLAADYRQRGMSETEARFAARRELGNRTSLEQRYREQNSLPALEIFWHDLKYSVRTLRRHPAFTASSLATLAIGLSGMITVLCVISSFFWTPLPYPTPERLFVLQETDPRAGSWTFSGPTLLDLKQRSQSLESISGFRRLSSALAGSGNPETISSAAVTPEFFSLFGIRPLAGKIFGASRNAVVISPRLWQRKWQRDPSVVGRPIDLDGRSYVISGVSEPPRDLLPDVELLLFLDLQAADSRSAHDIEVVGRFRPGIAASQAQAELSAVAAGMAREHPGTNTGWGMKAVPLFAYVIGPRTTRMLWMIFCGVALVWLLACTNVAGLQLARRVSQTQEIATRLALGASRRRLFAQSLTENAVLGAVGGLFGFAIAAWAIYLLRRFASDSLPRLASLQIDVKTVAAAFGCLLISTLLFGILPAPRSLLPGQRRTSARDGGRDALMIAQVAFASVLLLCAALLTQSFLRLRAVHPGFDPDKLLAIRISPSVVASTYWQRTAFLRDITTQLARVPGVEAVGATNVALFSGSGTANRFRREQESAASDFHSAAWRAVTPGFFRTLQIPLQRGRLFTDADANGSLEVVIITDSMARQFWPDEDPVGKRLLWGSSGRPKTIVGIVGDIRDLTVSATPVPMMFRPFAQLSDAPMTTLMRVAHVTPDLLATLRKTIWAVDPQTPVNMQSVRHTMSDSLLPERGALEIMTIFASVALLIAAFGLYGLVSYRVSQRKLEIGIRLALGASPNVVRWMIQKRCAALVCYGLAVGLPVAYALSRLLSPLLYQTPPTETTAYAAVLLVFSAVVLLAASGPANQAARLSPAALIRHE